MLSYARRLMTRLSTRKQASEQATADQAEKNNRHKIDPLDPRQRQGWQADKTGVIMLTAKDFPIYERNTSVQTFDAVDGAPAKEVVTLDRVAVTDAMEKIHGVAMDDGAGSPTFSNSFSPYSVPEQLLMWYQSQSFIGYQSCAIIAQHWLVDKACTMAGDDAARHGWNVKSADGNPLSDEHLDKIKKWDTEHNVKSELIEFNRFKNVFGIRVALFEVESDDKEYYSKPFNIDGVKEGSYKGISQVDPYWMMPMLTAESSSDPSSRHFYDPEFWIISGRRYHRSHLIISRGPEPADILKPTYIFGGIPMTQRIYERVYAAERTANEAPLLAMNKRTTALHVDLAQAMANQNEFEARLMTWIRYRDNHAVKVLGLEEQMEQFDTSLSDFDAVIMNQYQIVAAISKTPSTKLLGTSPKGFNATGEFEMKTYHEECEGIQEHEYTPLLSRHYQILCKSQAIEVRVEVVWNPVDSMTAKEQADLNNTQADAAQKYTALGAVSPDEVRDNLRDNPHSGFNRLTDADAEEKPGSTPENLAAMEKAGAEKLAAVQPGAAATPVAPGAEGEADDAPQGQGQLYPYPKTPASATATPRSPGESPRTEPVPGQQATTIAEPGIVAPERSPVATLVAALVGMLEQVDDSLLAEGKDVVQRMVGVQRSVNPSVMGINNPSVAGIGQTVGALERYKMPKVKMHGMVMMIENPRGTIRQGVTLAGDAWRTKMPHHYGFIKNVMGADGDELDCFVGPNMAAPNVYVINQNEPTTGQFDEHKCMFGFDTPEEAKQAYVDAYQAGWGGFDSMHELTAAQFKTWAEGDCTNALSAAEIPQMTSALQTN